MSVRNRYIVSTIKPHETHDWLLNKHYAKRIPSISYAFGLYDFGVLVGILTIGKPASPSLCDGICGIKYSKYVYELNRLCVNNGLEKNALSFFVSTCLKTIGASESLIIVSYADKQWNHHGYIYQATNWIYTGYTAERTDIGEEDGSHSRHYKRGSDYSIRKFRSSKYRYVYFVGKLRREFDKSLKYNRLPYPKGDNKRYDASYSPRVQLSMF